MDSVKLILQLCVPLCCPPCTSVVSVSLKENAHSIRNDGISVKILKTAKSKITTLVKPKPTHDL